jgi:hypothetical protein
MQGENPKPGRIPASEYRDPPVGQSLKDFASKDSADAHVRAFTGSGTLNGSRLYYACYDNINRFKVLLWVNEVSLIMTKSGKDVLGTRVYHANVNVGVKAMAITFSHGLTWSNIKENAGAGGGFHYGTMLIQWVPRQH